MHIIVSDNDQSVCYEVDQEYGIDFCEGFAYWTELECGVDHRTPIENVLRVITDKTI